MLHTLILSLNVVFPRGPLGPTSAMLRNFNWIKQFYTHFEELLSSVSILTVMQVHENQIDFYLSGSQPELVKSQQQLESIVAMMNKRINKFFLAQYNCIFLNKPNILFAELSLKYKSIACGICMEQRDSLTPEHLANHLENAHS